MTDLFRTVSMATDTNYRFLADKLRAFAERLRRDRDSALDDPKDSSKQVQSKRVEEIEWCIQGLDGYCS